MSSQGRRVRSVAAIAASAVSRRAIQLQGAARRIRGLRLPWLPVTVMATLAICAAFAPLLAPHDPIQINLEVAKTAPGNDWSYILGTDILGRDILSRLIFGARTSVFISLVALSTGALMGTLLGLVSGYKGGWLDAFIMRASDAALGFPTLLVAMILVVFLGTGLENIILAVTVTVWARFARMIRGDVLSIKQLDFITLAQVGGLSSPVIIARHVFPNVVNTLMVITSLQIGQVILLEASLSFLGLGVPPGHPAWGVMVAEGRTEIVNVWWLSLFPGLAITFVVLAFNFFGDWLRDTLDPKLRRL